MSERRRNRSPRGQQQLPARPRLPFGRSQSGPPSAPVRKRRVSRAERDARRQRRLTFLVSLAAVVCVLIVAISAVEEYWVKPRTVLATVDGTKIIRKDYWKYRIIDLINQQNQYNQLYNIYQQFQPDQAQQYLQLAASIEQQIPEVWGSTDVDQDTLNKMVDDQVYLKNMDELGIEITEADLDQFILTQFQPSDAPLISPTPTATYIPTRAAWATETVVANSTATAVAATEAALALTPPTDPALAGTPQAGAAEIAPTQGLIPSPPVLSTPTPTIGTAGAGSEATPVPGTPADGTPGAGTPGAGTPDAGTPGAGTPEASPAESATPNAEQALATAESGYQTYQDNVFDIAHLDTGDYKRLVARPLLARDRVSAHLTAQIGQSAEQIHGYHILVSTKELADSLKAQLDAGADFQQLARDNSTDTTTAPNGGDLGWFPRTVMVRPFDEVAFSLQPGQVSAPVSTQYGWHLILVTERDPNRPLTDEQITSLQRSVVERWVEDRRAQLDITGDIEPTPTTTASFEAPPGAPTVAPTPTVGPGTPTVGSPVAGTPTDGSPVATPVGGTPVASPEVATPVAVN